MELCSKNDEKIKELIETGTFEEINAFVCTNCNKCAEDKDFYGCDGLAWLNNIVETGDDVFRTLADIRQEIDNESISYGEIHYLQTHKEEVMKTGDIVLAQWADISEEEWNNGELNPSTVD